MGGDSKEIMNVDSVTVQTQGHDQVVTLVLRYTGTADLSAKIIQGQQLSVELPTHAPPG